MSDRSEMPVKHADRRVQNEQASNFPETKSMADNNTAEVTRNTRDVNTKKNQRNEFVMPERPDYYKSITQNIDVRHMLKKYGMQSGFWLPFATNESKNILLELEAMQIKNLKLRGEIEESQTAINDLKEHETQAAIDIKFTQSLIDAKTQQLDRESNDDIIEQKGCEKKRKKIAKINKEISEYYERNRIRLLDLDRRKDRVNSLQEKVYLAKKRLEEWKAQSENKESFLNLIMGHLELDDKNATELEDKQIKLGVINKKLRSELDSAARSTTKLSEQYTRLCIEYKKEYGERKEMVAMWSATIEAMKSKDTSVKEISEEYCELRRQIREAELAFAEKEKVVLELEWSVRQSDLDQNILDRRIGDLKLELMRIKETLLNAKHEVLTGKVIIQQTSIAIQGVVDGAMKAEARQKYFLRKIKLVEEHLVILKKRLKDILDGSTSVVTNLAKLDEELKEEEKLFNQRTKEVEKMRKFHWERSNDKINIEEQIARTEARHSRIKSSISILQYKEYENMAALAKTQSRVYKIDLELSQLDARMNRLVDESMNPQYFKLRSILNGLHVIEADTIKEKDYVQKEVHVVRDLTFKYMRQIDVYTKKQIAMQTMVNNINLDNKRQEVCLNDYNNKKRTLAIQLSMTQVRLKTLSNEYKLNRGSVLSLAQRRATMEWAVLERKSEIKFAVQMLIKHRKELRGHTSKRRLALSNINSFMEKLKGRFELVTRLMSHDSDLQGEESMAFQIHKLARERETLLGEKKRWESRIMEASQEVKGLTNCVLIMRCSNDSFRDNLAIASKTSAEAQEIETLMKNQKESIVVRNRCNKTVATLKRSLDALQKQVDVTIQETSDLTQLLDQKNRENSTKLNEHARLNDRLHRWNHLLNKKTLELKKNFTNEFLKTASFNLKYQLTALKFQKALGQLEITISENPRLKDIVYSYLKEHNMMREFEKAQEAIARLTTTTDVIRSTARTSSSSRQSVYSGAPRMLDKTALSKVRQKSFLPSVPNSTSSTALKRPGSTDSSRHSTSSRVSVPRFGVSNRLTTKKELDAYVDN